VDSRCQQTEWNHAGTEARFVKKFDALNVDLTYEEGKDWQRRMGFSTEKHWRVDSEFAPAPEFPYVAGEITYSDVPHHSGPKSQSSPNIHTMSDREFERHLKKLRTASSQVQGISQ
jgi:hypothetical protein